MRPSSSGLRTTKGMLYCCNKPRSTAYDPRDFHDTRQLPFGRLRLHAHMSKGISWLFYQISKKTCSSIWRAKNEDLPRTALLLHCNSDHFRENAVIVDKP